MRGKERAEIGEQIRAARRGRGLSRRALGMIGILGVLCVVAGFASAQLLGVTDVTTKQTLYSGQGSTDSNFGTPTLTATFVTTGPATCSSAAQNYPAPSGNNYNLVLYTGVNTTCATSAFAEEFVFASPASLTAESATVTISTEYSGTYTYSMTYDLTVTGGPVGGSALLTLYVEYGSDVPQQGISTLEAVVT